MVPAHRPDLHDTLPASRRDPGTSLIEILISVVLMGTVVVAVLVALQVTTIGSRVDRDQANVYAWLQAASDEIYMAPRMSCAGNTRAQIISHYDLIAKRAAAPPEWTHEASIAVEKVQFLGRSTRDGQFTWDDNFCFESTSPGGTYYESPLLTQKITIVARAPGGGVSATLETIKSE